MPHQGDWQTAKTYRTSRLYNSILVSYLPVRSTQTGLCQPQDGELPPTLSFLKVEPDNLSISTIKKAERNSSIIARLYNITDTKVDAKIGFYKKIKAANLVNMNEERIKELSINQDNTLTLPVSPKQIVTIEIFPKE